MRQLQNYLASAGPSDVFNAMARDMYRYVSVPSASTHFKRIFLLLTVFINILD